MGPNFGIEMALGLGRLSQKISKFFEMVGPMVNCGEKQQMELLPFVLMKHPIILGCLFYDSCQVELSTGLHITLNQGVFNILTYSYVFL